MTEVIRVPITFKKVQPGLYQAESPTSPRKYEATYAKGDNVYFCRKWEHPNSAAEYFKNRKDEPRKFDAMSLLTKAVQSYEDSISPKLTLTPTPSEEVTSISGYRCVDCGELMSPEDVGPQLYECGNCGEVYNRDNSQDGNSHKCPSCGKFGKKSSPHSCNNCSGAEVEEVDLYLSPIGGLFEQEDTDV